MLSADYGRGFSKHEVQYMLHFAEVFPDSEILQALRAQLSWRSACARSSPCVD